MFIVRTHRWLSSRLRKQKIRVKQVLVSELSGMVILNEDDFTFVGE